MRRPAFSPLSNTFFQAVLFLVLMFLPNYGKAQISIPLIGADDSLSQYVCVTIPGVKTFSMKVVLSNGRVQDITVKMAKSQIEKQINSSTQKILQVSILLQSADTKKKREKLQAKLKSLRSQRNQLKFIKTQIEKCAKAKLEFNAANLPVLLTNTISNPSFSRPVHVFMYGFKFTVPNNYKADEYCVAVNGASNDLLPLGGVVYHSGVERTTEGEKSCRTIGGPLEVQCVPGLSSDERMILLTGGAVVDGDGPNCTTNNCSLEALMNYLSTTYSNPMLTSFKPGACN